jgi:hypothetical protein
MACSAPNVYHTCRADNPDYIAPMSKLCMLILLVVTVLISAGCQTHSGSREYAPGKGWQQN